MKHLILLVFFRYQILWTQINLGCAPTSSPLHPPPRISDPNKGPGHFDKQLIIILPYMKIRASYRLDELLSVDLGPDLSFLSNIGPSFDGVTIKKNFVDIRGKRSFETRNNSSSSNLHLKMLFVEVREFKIGNLDYFCHFHSSFISPPGNSYFSPKVGRFPLPT